MVFVLLHILTEAIASVYYMKRAKKGPKLAFPQQLCYNESLNYLGGF